MAIFDQIALAKEIRSKLDEMQMDDAELIQDTLEGQTDIYEIMDWLLGKISDEKSMQDAIMARLEKLQTRRGNSANRVQHLRGILQMAMEAAGEKSVKRPEATITLSNKAIGIQSIDESKLPEEFFKLKKEVDKTLVKDALKQGEVPGVMLDNGGLTLTIRY